MKENIPIWITRDGQEIPLNEIKNSHLLSIRNWLKRQSDNVRKFYCLPEPQGEMALLDFENAWEFTEEHEIFCFEWLETINKEIINRRLS